MQPIARGLCLMAALSVVAFGCRAQATSPSGHDRQVTQLRERLQRQGDTDSVAAAALLIDGQTLTEAERLALLRQAVQRSPERADLRLRMAQTCVNVRDCDARAVVDELVVWDPDNGPSYLMRLEVVDSDPAFQGSLVDLGNARRFEGYGMATLAHLMRTLMTTAGYRPPLAQAKALGSGMGSNPYAIGKLIEACGPPATDEASRLEACRRVAALMQRADDLISLNVGYGLARQLWPEGSVEHAQAERGLQVVHYQTRAWGQLMDRHLSDATALEYLRLCDARTPEQDVTAAMLIRAHREPEPPLG